MKSGKQEVRAWIMGPHTPNLSINLHLQPFGHRVKGTTQYRVPAQLRSSKIVIHAHPVTIPVISTALRLDG